MLYVARTFLLQNARDKPANCFSSAKVGKNAETPTIGKFISYLCLSDFHNKIVNITTMDLSFYPYPLQLQHQFTVANYSRSTTPGVQLEIHHKGITGYGEASMPPYLGETVDSVVSFLNKLKLKQFTDPLQIDQILDYIDGVAPENCAAKAAVDIALHDLVGKIKGKPCYSLLEMDKTKAPDTFYTIGIDSIPKMVEKPLK